MAGSRSWIDLSGKPYRLQTVYDQMKWPSTLELSTCEVYASKFSGPVAVVSGLQESRNNCTISIHTSSGMRFGQINWRRGVLLRVIWTVSEDMLCVQDDGQVYVYDIFGVEQKQKQFSMGKECQSLGVVSCRSLSQSNTTALAVLHTENRIFIVSDVRNPKLWRAPDLQRKAESPSCWTLCSSKTGSGPVVVYVLANEIYLLSQNKPPEQLMVESHVKQYIDCCVNCDSTKIALLSENGLVQIFALDLKDPSCLSQFDCNVRGKPQDFLCTYLRCGLGAVAVYDKSYLTLISCDNDSLRYAFDASSYLCEEVDGIRIYSQSSHTFIGKVPEAVREVFKVASDTPGGYLYAALLSYRNESCQAYDYMSMIGDQLADGVKQCIEAACNEFETENQKTLLQAASLGKCLCSGGVAKSELPDACRLLRALNACRAKHFALALTYKQMQVLTVPVLLDRLILRKQWPLAVNIAEYLRLPVDVGVHWVLAHWANSKIEEQRNKLGSDRLPSHVLAECICRKLEQHPGISYADVAEKAAASDLKELATLLLEHEHQLIKQVNMLLKLGQHTKALSTAAESADPDLMYHVVLNLKQSMDRAQLGLTLHKFPAAFNLYKEYCKQESSESYKALCKQQDDHIALAKTFLALADEATVFETREKQDAILQAQKCFQEAKETFFANATGERSKLIKIQNNLEQTHSASGQPFLDLSLRDTVIWLEANGYKTNSESLRKEFKISDKQFWYWKIEGLAKAGKESELMAFSKQKKPPVGYLPFIEIFMKYESDPNSEACTFWQSKLTSEEQVKGLILRKNLQAAAEKGLELNDASGLDAVLSHCKATDKHIADKIWAFKQKLGTK